MENKTYIFEGKTSTEAIEKGLKELKVSKSQVDIKVLEQEDKRSFFSILAPRVVKVEMTIKEGAKEAKKTDKKEENKVQKTEHKAVSKEEIDNSEAAVKKFLDEFLKTLPTKNLKYDVNETENNTLEVNIDGDDTGYLIGYRGEVLNSIQSVVSNVASKTSKEKIKVLVNIGGYREKREKDLQNLAVKIAGTVIKTRKDVTLEPMTAYERKIIHTKLQDSSKVKTYSIGEEPYRKVVVTLK